MPTKTKRKKRRGRPKKKVPNTSVLEHTIRLQESTIEGLTKKVEERLEMERNHQILLDASNHKDKVIANLRHRISGLIKVNQLYCTLCIEPE